MRGAHRIGLAVVTAALTMAWSAGYAGDPPRQGAEPPVNPGLLEFLGSGDPSTDTTQPDDGSWVAYLSQVNISKVAKASQPPPGSTRQKPASGDKPSGKGSRR